MSGLVCYRINSPKVTHEALMETVREATGVQNIKEEYFKGRRPRKAELVSLIKEVTGKEDPKIAVRKVTKRSIKKGPKKAEKDKKCGVCKKAYGRSYTECEKGHRICQKCVNANLQGKRVDRTGCKECGYNLNPKYN